LRHYQQIQENEFIADFLLGQATDKTLDRGDYHRLVLAAATPYFKVMLITDTAEAKAGRTNLGCSEKLGRNFIKFLYTSEIKDVLDENTEEFLCLGDKYAVPELKQRAESRMLQLLSRETMVAFFIAGDVRV
jgi:hypothetical protein